MSNDNPQYLWGRKNPNWNGPSKASKDSIVSGGRGAASGDFTSSPTSPEKVSVDDADLDTKLGDIDFSECTSQDPWQDDAAHVGAEYTTIIYADEGGVTMGYEFEDNPQGFIESILEEHNEETGEDIQFHSDMTYDWEKGLNDWAMFRGLTVDTDTLENDYSRVTFYASEDDPDKTLEDLHDKLNAAYNAETYVIPDELKHNIMMYIKNSRHQPSSVNYDSIDELSREIKNNPTAGATAVTVSAIIDDAVDHAKKAEENGEDGLQALRDRRDVIGRESEQWGKPKELNPAWTIYGEIIDRAQS